MTARVLRVVHARYGTGWWQRLLDPGQCLVSFDADNGIERRVLVRDLGPEREGTHGDEMVGARV